MIRRLLPAFALCLSSVLLVPSVAMAEETPPPDTTESAPVPAPESEPAPAPASAPAPAPEPAPEPVAEPEPAPAPAPSARKVGSDKTVSTASPTANDNRKVWVCKVVGKPGTSDAVHHVNSVSVNAVGGPQDKPFPWEFNDAQSSKAVGWADEIGEAEALALCAPKPPVEVPTPTDPTPTAGKKVWVCKIVGTPGPNGVVHHVIDVSVNAVGGVQDKPFPWDFNDAQYSKAVGYSDTMTESEALAACNPTPPVDPEEPVDPDDPPVVEQVWVCSYLALPIGGSVPTGVAQVPVTQLPAGFPGTFPWSFADGASKVLGYATGTAKMSPEPTILDCLELPPPVDPPTEPGKKVWVCKIVAKPDSNEFTHHVISVSVNAVGGVHDKPFPWEFNDAQYSKAVGYSDTMTEAEAQALCDPPPVEPDDPTVWVCKVVLGSEPTGYEVVEALVEDVPPITGAFPFPFTTGDYTKALGYANGDEAVDAPPTTACPPTPGGEEEEPDPTVWVCQVVRGSQPIAYQVVEVLVADVPPITGHFPFPFTTGDYTKALGYANGDEAVDAPPATACPPTPGGEEEEPDPGVWVCSAVDETKPVEYEVIEVPESELPAITGTFPFTFDRGPYPKALGYVDDGPAPSTIQCATMVPNVPVDPDDPEDASGVVVTRPAPTSLRSLPDTGTSATPTWLAIGALLTLVGTAVLTLGRRRDE